MITLSKDWLSLCNEALSLCNKDQMQSLGEGSQQSLSCSTLLPGIISRVLYERDWKCAKKRVRIAPDASAPAFGYSFQFTLPSDFIRPCEVNAESWVLEGGKILSDEKPIDLIYIAFPDGPSNLNSELRAAIVYYLASEIALTLTSDTSMVSTYRTLAETEIARAKLNESAGEKDLLPVFNTWQESFR